MAKANSRSKSNPAVRHGLVLNADQAETLTELCTLAAYSDGFTFTNDMMALAKHVADLSDAAARRACLAQAAARELVR